jgi:hypothetical protein
MRTGPTLALIALAAVGCGYSVRPPFDQNIRTVYVPVFKSVSFQRDLNIQLTEKVQDEIRRRTPYRVVGTPEEADSTLDGTIRFVDKNAALESPNNLPRQIQAQVVAEVKWTDNRLPPDQKKEIVPNSFVELVHFYNEIGETTQLGFDKALDKLARQIVDSMEARW